MIIKKLELMKWSLADKKMNQGSEIYSSFGKFLLNYSKFILLMFLGIACNTVDYEPLNSKAFTGISPDVSDELKLAEGFSYQVLIKSLDTISDEELFGYDVSGLYFIANPASDSEGELIVNHEFMNPMLATGFYEDMARMRKHIQFEQKATGASMLKLKRDGNDWGIAKSGNRRISAATPISLQKPMKGVTATKGTAANKSVVKTPWNTFLTAESVYSDYFGDIDQNNNQFIAGKLDWEPFLSESPYGYGWVVEADFDNNNFVKLTSLGRLKRGGMTMHINENQLSVYFSDKSPEGCLFKFVSDDKNNLSKGKIYVANLKQSKWLKVSLENDSLRSLYKNNYDELLVDLSRAGKIAGGTLLDHPSGMTINPASGNLYFTTTYNINKQKYHGSVIELVENGEDFSWDTVIAGGEESGISCPASIAFDLSNNLWVASDIPSHLISQGAYSIYGNNGLFAYSDNNKLTQIASAPVDANFSGISFSADNKFIFLGVQQPGSRSATIYDFDFTSHWPEGGKSKPKSSVVVLGRR